MKKQALWIISIWMIGGLAACNLPVNPTPAATGGEVVLQYQTVSALLTATAGWNVILTPIPEPSSLPVQPTKRNFRPTDTPEISVLTDTPAALPGSVLITSEPQCDQAQAGRPIDVTIPDGTEFRPGEYFSKTWRLLNSGQCPWMQDYAVIWFSGDDLGMNRVQPIGSMILPGESVDVTVDMAAPQAPGTYQSNWKLQNKDGELFGIGPNGEAPFWVRIIVVPADTPTPTITIPVATATPAPTVVAEARLTISLDESFDMDMWDGISDPDDDVAFRRSDEGQLALVPLTPARLGMYGVTLPEMEDCLLAPVGETPVELEQLAPDFSFCYRTSENLPGRLRIVAVDTQNNFLDLDFITWEVP